MKRLFCLAVVLLALAGCSGDDLTGLWEGVDLPYELELRDDGTATDRWTDTGSEIDYAWSVEGDQLCLFLPGREPGEGDCADYTLEGDRLLLVYDGSNIRLERWID